MTPISKNVSELLCLFDNHIKGSTYREGVIDLLGDLYLYLERVNKEDKIKVLEGYVKSIKDHRAEDSGVNYNPDWQY